MKTVVILLTKFDLIATLREFQVGFKDNTTGLQVLVIKSETVAVADPEAAKIPFDPTSDSRDETTMTNSVFPSYMR